MSDNILDYFEETVRKRPDNIAAIDCTKEYSYRQMMEYAKKTAMLFAGERKAPVIVLCKRDIRCLVIFWGIIYSGNFYVPLDEKLPIHRLRDILSHTGARKLVLLESNETVEKCCDDLEIEVVCFEKEFEKSEIDEEQLYKIRSKMLDADPVYMVYTSGSTGHPKGVIKTQRSLISFLKSFQNVFNLQEDDVMGNQAAFDFDVAAKDIFLSVFAGGRIVIIPQVCFLIPKEMVNFLNQYGVTVLIWAVAGIRYLANSKILERQQPEFLRKVFFSGEVLQMSELRAWNRCLPHVQYVNLYAPTESTGNCMYYIVSDIEKMERIPLGRAFPNIEVMILNDKKESIQEKEVGEIYIRGAFLAQGYYNDSEKTKAGFVQNPQHDNYPDIVYRTGDLATCINGEYYYIGRTDNQIKHQGHRIELEEIEQALFQKTQKIKHCCAIFDDDEKQIVLVLNGKPIEDCEIRKWFMEILPKYMIPNKFVWIDKMPQNARGKLDREAVWNRYESWKNRKDMEKKDDE